MKQALIFCALILSFQLSAQSVEVGGGINTFSFFNITINEAFDWGPLYTEYIPNHGFTTKMALELSSLNKVDIRIAFSYSQVSGSAYERRAGSGGGVSTYVEVNKRLLALSFYGFNFNIKNVMDIGLGHEVSISLNDSFEGKKNEWRTGISGGYGSTENLEMIYDTFNNKLSIGAIGRIAYHLYFFDKTIMTIHYTYYHGFNNELKHFPIKVFSKRQELLLSFKKNLKSK